MRPLHPLPISTDWDNPDQYVDSLLNFVSTSELFRNLCGGVHVLDFLTRKPDLYSWILPQEWRDWFEIVDINDIIDLFLREDLLQFRNDVQPSDTSTNTQWRGYVLPPASLILYISTIRRHNIVRDFTPNRHVDSIPHHIAVGMKTKKIHEVIHFAAFVDDLSTYVCEKRQTQSQLGGADTSTGRECTPEVRDHAVTEVSVVDFGSGQNYLGRTLACPPYKKSVIAIEQRHHNVEGAKYMDVSAKLVKKRKNMINKKIWKQQWEARKKDCEPCGKVNAEHQSTPQDISELELRDMEERIPFAALGEDTEAYEGKLEAETPAKQSVAIEEPAVAPSSQNNDHNNQVLPDEYPKAGLVQYVEKELSSGNLSDISSVSSHPALVVSIHSCGNLTHHGLRSITLNPSVEAVALIGCCYNLLTERLGPPTYKLPTLRSNHPRLEATSTAFDPQGFPMSRRLEEYEYPISTLNLNKENKRVYNLNGILQDVDCTGRGVRLNITARMMAVQAPGNWSPEESEGFFTRHYYRALLQRILLDLGVVKMSTSAAQPDIEIAGGTLSGKDETGSPLIIGTLRKACFANFNAYVRGAIEKLCKDPIDGPAIQAKTSCLLENDGELINKYESDYRYAKKHLSVIWSLMAFSAGVVESTILVDRWSWLKEQEEVDEAWIEAVFDYKQSPRNMVVVGIKKEKC